MFGSFDSYHIKILKLCDGKTENVARGYPEQSQFHLGGLRLHEERKNAWTDRKAWIDHASKASHRVRAVQEVSPTIEFARLNL